MSDVLYLTIVSNLKQRIIKGEYKPGDTLDSETALMKKYNTTKMTIRKALSLLASKGFIYSIPGKGNYICKPETNIYSFNFNKYDKLNVQIDRIKLLSVNILNAIPSIYIKLQIPETESIIEITRLLFSNNKIIAYEKIYTQYIHKSPMVEDILKFANYIKLIEDEIAFAIEKQLKIEAVFPDEETKKHLKVSSNDIIYIIDEVIKNLDSKKVISYSQYFIKTKYLSITASQSFIKETKGIY